MMILRLLALLLVIIVVPIIRLPIFNLPFEFGKFITFLFLSAILLLINGLVLVFKESKLALPQK